MMAKFYENIVKKIFDILDAIEEVLIANDETTENQEGLC